MLRVGSLLLRGVVASTALAVAGESLHTHRTNLYAQERPINEINPGKQLTNTVCAFLKDNLPGGYELSSREIIEMYGWVMKISTEADALEKDKQDKYVKDQLSGVKKTYKIVTDESLTSLTDGVNKFRSLRNQADSNHIPAKDRIKHGDLLSNRGIISRATQFAQGAAMSGSQTHELIELMLGNNKTSIVDRITSQLDSYETNSRAKRAGEKLVETIRLHNSK
jgi:hypothetical protein